MKVFFGGSIHNKGITKELYHRIISYLQSRDLDVVTYHNEELSIDFLKTQTIAHRNRYYKQLTKWIQSADVLVCEISYPSTVNIGHEITFALDRGMPVVGLYQEGREPGMLQGINNEKFILCEYSLDDLEDVIDYGISEAETLLDTRFTMILPPAMAKFLDTVVKKGVSRSEYIRKLIQEDMKKREL